MKYSVDTSSLVRAWWDRYPIDYFPGFWDNVDGLVQSGELRACDEVRVELEKQDDELLAWLGERAQVFVEVDDPTQDALSDILSSHPTLIDARKGRSGADPWVIALAKVNRCRVVTEERPSTSLKRPQIPDVCRALDIPCINILDVIKEHGWVFKAE